MCPSHRVLLPEDSSQISTRIVVRFTTWKIGEGKRGGDAKLRTRDGTRKARIPTSQAKVGDNYAVGE